MPDARKDRGKGPPRGEYVVRHERPYPERMERAFRIGAAIVSAPILAAGVAAACYGFYLGLEIKGSLAALALGLMLSALAYAAVWAAGALLIGIVVAFRRKQYVVDWEERPPER